MRSSGILMHISSLPSPGGIGSMGQEAYEFADFLQASGMTIWQVLPIGPTGYGESPYQSSSVFAGNPLLISCQRLREEGLLQYDDSEEFVPENPETIEFDAVRKNKEMLLRRCYKQSAASLSGQIREFISVNPWVEDFALFTAVKNHFNQVMWTSWPDEGIRFRRPEAIRKYTEELRDDIDYHIFCQYIFRRQWFDLKKYCNDRSIRLFGDMPIYVAEDSADTWTHPEIFQLDRELIPKKVAGVPPDYFSEDGQLWGNPLYRWTYLRFCRKFDWWVDRMRGMAELYDMIRIDHFIGFANYYSVKHGMPNAREGKWVIGPGKALFKRLNQEVPGIQIIAEDLGCVNNRVRRLLNWCGYPGMKVLAYTGTHDNDTTRGWADRADPKVLDYAGKLLGFSKPEDAPEAFIRFLFRGPCDTVIIPMQDILGLDNSARMNYPGTIGGNWRWRMKPDQLSLSLSMKYYRLNKETNRR